MHPRDGLARLAAIALAATFVALAGCEPATEEKTSDAVKPAGPDDAAPTDSPRHLVLLILDTLRADRLGSYGFPADTSPALDALAQRGVRFERVLAQSSWTRPSIGSILTSRYPRTLGLYRERDEILDDSFLTLSEALRKHGYATLGLTANPNINSAYNFQQGFDDYVDSDAGFEWMGAAKESELPPLVPAAALLESTLERVTRVEPTRPVYVQLNLMDVHVWSARKSTRNTLRPEYANLFPDHIDASYLRLTRQLTDDVADFIATLSARPGWENALFCIVSDHGEGLSDHPNVARSRHHGVLLYASTVEVPWILFRKSWQPAHRVISQEVRLLDVAPTLLHLLELPVPEVFDGRSVRDLIDGGDSQDSPPRYRVAETQFRGSNRIAIYDDEWAYIHNRTRLPGLSAYELQARGASQDGAKTDRAPAHPDVVQEMQAYLRNWEEIWPRVPPTQASEELGEEERRQLEAIGYLPDESR